MVRLLLLDAAIFLGMIILTFEVQVIASQGCGYALCTYSGDPHLTPFSEPQRQYLCTKPGWELLLSNEYVTIYVLVGDAARHFSIIDVSS